MRISRYEAGNRWHRERVEVGVLAPCPDAPIDKRSRRDESSPAATGFGLLLFSILVILFGNF